MPDYTRRHILGLFAALPFLASKKSFAHSYALDRIRVGHCWALPNAPPVKETKGFAPLALMEKTGVPVKLEKISSPLAGKIELRRAREDGTFETLSFLELKPGQPVAMREGGLHIAFLDLRQDLKAGQRLPVGFTFTGHKPLLVEFIVENAPQHG